MSGLRTVVVVGASLAGLRAAEALRRLGFDGRLVLVGAEAHLPYDRPPLSKEVLAGRREPETLALRKAESWDELAVELRLGRAAVALRPAPGELELEGGERLRFDGCVIATGASPRRLPGVPEALEGVHVLRSLEDALALRAELERGPRVVVVGAGFIGSEVAATCRARGLAVTVVEPLAAPLVRGLGMQLGKLVAAVHRDHGVDLHCGVGVAGVEGARRVEGVRLADGTRVPADVVVVGIGAVPETRWLAGSGLALGDGVLCDAACASSAPNVVAAGDVARWRHEGYGETLRVEHWTNAVEQAAAAAERLLAGPAAAKPFAPVPYVWSDQYDMKLQIAGLPKPEDALRLVDGSFEERRFVALFERDGCPSAVVGMNRPRLVIEWRRKLREGLAAATA